MPTSASATRMLSTSLANCLTVGAGTTVAVLVTFIGDVGGAWAANNIDSLESAGAKDTSTVERCRSSRQQRSKTVETSSGNQRHRNIPEAAGIPNEIVRNPYKTS